MAARYKLKKQIWTDADFDDMSWHDCPIHAILLGKNNELLLDIDYIFKWLLTPNKKHFKFWVAPCTLVFENVYEIVLESDETTVVIDNISKNNPRVPNNAAYIGKDIEYDWLIETTAGEIAFKSVGYKQYVRQLPQLINAQELTMKVRGGISFDYSFSL